MCPIFQFFSRLLDGKPMETSLPRQRWRSGKAFWKVFFGYHTATVVWFWRAGYPPPSAPRHFLECTKRSHGIRAIFHVEGLENHPLLSMLAV